jgi:outer membrane cobalamin receptor
LVALAAARRQRWRSDHRTVERQRDVGDEVVVTATREPRDSLTTPASVSRIDGADLAELSAKHQSEA